MWTRLCSFNLELLRKHFPQTSHSYGFSPTNIDKLNSYNSDIRYLDFKEKDRLPFTTKAWDIYVVIKLKSVPVCLSLWYLRVLICVQLKLQSGTSHANCVVLTVTSTSLCFTAARRAYVFKIDFKQFQYFTHSLAFFQRRCIVTDSVNKGTLTHVTIDITHGSKSFTTISTFERSVSWNEQKKLGYIWLNLLHWGACVFWLSSFCRDN